MGAFDSGDGWRMMIVATRMRQRKKEKKEESKLEERNGQSLFIKEL